MQPKIGFMGLGIMGTPMAANLLKAGYAVMVYNRSPEKAEPLVKQGAGLASNPKALARAADVVIAMVTGPEAFRRPPLGTGRGRRGLQPQQGLHQHELGVPRATPGSWPGSWNQPASPSSTPRSPAPRSRPRTAPWSSWPPAPGIRLRPWNRSSWPWAKKWSIAAPPARAP